MIASPKHRCYRRAALRLLRRFPCCPPLPSCSASGADEFVEIDGWILKRTISGEMPYDLGGIEAFRGRFCARMASSAPARPAFRLPIS